MKKSKFEYVTLYSEKLQKSIRFQLNKREGYGSGAYNIIANKRLKALEERTSQIDVEISKATDAVNQLAALYNSTKICDAIVFKKKPVDFEEDEFFKQVKQDYLTAKSNLAKLQFEKMSS